MERLSTTSYAVLSLLGVRSWSTYQLAQQMDRSVGRMWPRATSVVYEEPKRLVRVGFAETTTEYTGKRASTVYSITDAGRVALAEWMEEGGSGPSLEFEALLKIAFCDNGSIDALRANVAAARAWAEDDRDLLDERLDEYAAGGPYPERLPVIALASRFYLEMNEAVLRWVDWVERVTAEWDGTTPAAGADVPPDAFTRPDRG